MDLRQIDTFLLDMDGTLLDKHFDDYFWEHLVPLRYAELNQITFEEARQKLLSLYKSHEGTLNWTDIDFWSRELGIDIAKLKEQIKHLIAVHPNVEDFLEILKRQNKQVLMVTNAHFKVLDLKLKNTHIGHYFDRFITSFDIGCPKEDISFWHRLQQTVPFKKDRVLFIDDTCEVLYTARRFGLTNLIRKTRANSKRPDKPCPDFYTIEDFKELIELIES